ncbi:MAG: hypothetical protein OHK93_008033 [Ramalina farinacea]|uniref:Protein kinase domain-containing protein n=1 Tax=Ramalina farinacea TaxID=258253 RepID=A0AA43QLP8_9LECA|nr:hypothetical protein [Ramalina farinacea]
MWSLPSPKDSQQSREYSESIDLSDLTRRLELNSSDSGSSRLSFSAREFVKVLTQLRIPGLLMPSHLRKETEIAQGRQFTVHRCEAALINNDVVRWNLAEVAVKRCRVENEAQDSFDLTSVRFQKQVHDMYLEVCALGNRALRQHRNIVELLGWAPDTSSTAMPLLIMELAMGNLVHLLSHLDSDSDEWNVKHHVCLDISAGLDAIHQTGIVHADFKPRNILIFETSTSQVKYIAKLADFGFSVTELDDTSARVVPSAGFTEVWEAPEIRRCRTAGEKLTAQDYFKADNYSLGLVVWSSICFRGDAPPVDDNIARSIEAMRSIPEGFSRLIIHAIQSVLCPEPCDRPTTVAGLFRDESDACQAW